MSAKYSASVCLLLLIAVINLSEAFNSERKSHDSERALHDPEQDPPDWSARTQHQPSKQQDDDDSHSGDRKVRVVKRRHLRRRRDPWSQDYLKEIFDIPTDLKEPSKPSNNHRRSAQESQFAAFSQFPYFQPQHPSYTTPPKQVAPNFFHNTLVPNGPQVNNYYLPNSQQGALPQGWPQFPFAQNWQTPYFQPAIIYFVPYPCFPQQAPKPPTPDLPPIPINPMNRDNITNRFGDGEEIPWGVEDANPPPARPETRPSEPRPRPPGTVRVDEYFNTPTGISLKPIRPLRPPSRAPPPIQHSSTGDARPPPARPGNQRPAPTTTTTTRPAPQNINSRPGNSNDQPSKCVWAIISCCQNPPAARPPTRCFEQMGCSGAFWDRNPCDTEFAKAATNAAKEFYNQPARG